MSSARARPSLTRYANIVHHHLSRPGTGPVYVFHHIPKTGGSSINRVLPLWFYRVRDFPVRVDPDDWTAGHQASPPLDLSQMRANDCLSGHWADPGEYLHERYPAILKEPRYRLFTFVREPLQLKLSLYFWEKRQGKEFGNKPVEDELLDRPNYLSERFPCGEEDYESVLSRYFFVGATEHLQESFDKLAELVDRPRVRLPHANRSRSKADTVKFRSGFLDEFRAVNRLDYLVYDHCIDRLRSG